MYIFFQNSQFRTREYRLTFNCITGDFTLEANPAWFFILLLYHSLVGQRRRMPLAIFVIERFNFRLLGKQGKIYAMTSP